MNLAEKSLIETVLRKCEEWRCCACSSIKDVEELLNRMGFFDRLHSDVILDIEQLKTKVESVANAGHFLGFDFPEISELHNAASTLKWCSKVVSYCFKSPSREVTMQKLAFVWLRSEMCSVWLGLFILVCIVFFFNSLTCDPSTYYAGC